MPTTKSDTSVNRVPVVPALVAVSLWSTDLFLPGLQAVSPAEPPADAPADLPAEDLPAEDLPGFRAGRVVDEEEVNPRIRPARSRPKA
jgi:hypothetical protein